MNAAKRYLLIALMFFIFVLHTLAQNIGINQPNPIWPLDIIAPQSVIRLVTTTSNYGSTLELQNTNASAEYLGVINFNDPAATYPGQISYKANHSMSFRVGQQERMIIDNQGRLGIGNQSPLYTIDVSSVGASINLLGYSPLMVLRSNDPQAPYFGAITFTGDGGSPGQISYSPNHTLRIQVNNLVRLMINDAGLTGVNRIPLTNRIEVEGNASKSTAGDWLANSDSRLKKNIKQLDSQAMLDKLLSLEGISYEWNDDKTGSKRPEGIQFGFIAQNIQEAFPTLVEEDNLGYLQTAYGTYDPMMVEAIRALNDRIKFLEGENEELKSIIEEIKIWITAKNK
ncbi:MAG TPA: tail fiber domain-containing protein [Saprospiraceae bacterium]|nr:tail fiber domain-containing protein [Saprospiraceae bacterium]